jgi:thymidylate kinase
VTGTFITIDGPGGSGKTATVAALARACVRNGTQAKVCTAAW